MKDQLEIIFVEYNLESFVTACLKAINNGAKRIQLSPFNRFAAELVKKISAHKLSITFYAHKNELEVTSTENVSKCDSEIEKDAVILFIPEAKFLSERLMDYLDFDRVTIIAPITQHYYKHNPLFVISIPKSGTHLLYRLSEIFGYKPGIILDDQPSSGKWYCLEYSNSHTSAKDFFIDTVRRSPFGNRHHPFPRSPAIFFYRNPLDVLVSEANYYHKDDKTLFHGYLNKRSFEERLLTLIDDPWLLGSIRDRIGNFIPWLEFSNVIPVSFEEIVGSLGGGSEKKQIRLIWSLQLKLHIPGNPKRYGEMVFDKNSQTFREGQIGSHKKSFTKKAYDKFYSLPQDFMNLLGYGNGPQISVEIFSKRAEEFRTRSLKYSEANFENTPILIESGYLNHNIVKYGSLYYGIPKFYGELRLGDQSGFILKLLPSDKYLLELKLKIINRRKIPFFVWKIFGFTFLVLKRKLLKSNSKTLV